MYGEPFDIPAPDTLVFVSWFPGGEVFRSGCCYHRGKGKIFYFRPGHETYPIYHDNNVRRVIANTVQWAKPTEKLIDLHVRRIVNSPPLEKFNLMEDEKSYTKTGLPIMTTRVQKGMEAKMLPFAP